MSSMDREWVGLPDIAWEIIDTKLKGPLGSKRSAIIRNIIMIYLAERGYARDFLMNKKGRE